LILCPIRFTPQLGSTQSDHAPNLLSFAALDVQAIFTSSGAAARKYQREIDVGQVRTNCV
jgi:hypothetical protein